MTRLAATLLCDVRLQARNGFYHAVGFLLLVWAIVVGQLPALDWTPWLPPLLLGNLLMATFFFFAGLVLLEKSEGTLSAQIVTPLSAGEYLTSKTVTLSALSLVESAVLVTLTHGPDCRWPLLAAGVVAASALYSLSGFLLVSRYDSVDEFLLPAMFYTAVFFLPLLDYLGLLRSPLFYLHPFQASLVLLEAAFLPVAGWEIVYGLICSALWIALVMVWSRRVFHRFVVERIGAH